MGIYWQHQNRRFDLIVTSTLARVQETASIVAAALRQDYQLDTSWMEKDNGPLAGLDPKDAETQRRFPIPAFRSWSEPLTTEGGESDAELSRRADEAIEGLVRARLRTVLVVSHGRILSTALAYLLGASSAHFVWGDTAYAEVVIDRGTDRITVVSLNQAAHLAEQVLP